MHKKALTVAIAAALAAPMAAQAVDFSISGWVNRALFITDTDDGTNAAVANNGGGSTRVRATGSSEMMDGRTVGIQFEFEEGSSMDEDGDKKTDSILKLRHANIQYGGDFGRITIGQGSEAGDGSAYSDTTGVRGIGHGAGTGAGFSLGDYFGSLDGGTRTNMIRYDTPDIGLASVAVSLGNNDRVSARVKLSTEMGGTTIGAQIATLREDGYKQWVSKETVGASVGLTMASGLTLSGAWAKGDGHGGTGAMEEMVGIGCFENNTGVFLAKPDEDDICAAGGRESGIIPAMDAVPKTATDPSYYQVEVGYKFGDTGVAVSWYNSEDFKTNGSEGTAIGIGVRHTLGKTGAEIYAAVQNYDVTKKPGGMSEDESVVAIGTLVNF